MQSIGLGVNHATELLHGLTLPSQALKHPQKISASVAESMKISRGAIKKTQIFTLIPDLGFLEAPLGSGTRM